MLPQTRGENTWITKEAGDGVISAKGAFLREIQHRESAPRTSNLMTQAKAENI
jgi:hypothetical protein